MALVIADRIASLRGRTLADLDAANDYDAETRIAWKVIRELVAGGLTFKVIRELVAGGLTFEVRNAVAGTEGTAADLAGRSHGYVAGQLTEATFQQLIAIFEAFIADLLRAWLTRFPAGLGGRQVDFAEVVDLPDKEAIIVAVVDREVLDIMHGPPRAWFWYLNSHVDLGCPDDEAIGRFAEAKALRDVLVHGRGVAGKDYRANAGGFARYQAGDRVDVSHAYHQSVWVLLRSMVNEISDAALARTTPSDPTAELS